MVIRNTPRTTRITYILEKLSIVIFIIMKGKEIKNYPIYTITEDGEVWSSSRKKPFKLKPQGASQNKRYLQVRLFSKEYPNGKLNYIHRLVYENYVGEIPEGKTIDHIDNNPFNNHYTNLQLMTQSENSSKGNAPRKKLVDMKDVIRQLYQDGWTQPMIAEHFDCSSTHIWRIINRKRQSKINGKWVYYDMLD